MSFFRFKEILNTVQKKHPGLAERLQEAQALSFWEEVVGETIVRHARVTSVREGVLWVEVDHPAWQTELLYRKNQIIEKLNAHQKQNIFKDIHFTGVKGSKADRAENKYLKGNFFHKHKK